MVKYRGLELVPVINTWQSIIYNLLLLCQIGWSAIVHVIVTVCVLVTASIHAHKQTKVQTQECMTAYIPPSSPSSCICQLMSVPSESMSLKFPRQLTSLHKRNQSWCMLITMVMLLWRPIKGRGELMGASVFRLYSPKCAVERAENKLRGGLLPRGDFREKL